MVKIPDIPVSRKRLDTTPLATPTAADVPDIGGALQTVGRAFMKKEEKARDRELASKVAKESSDFTIHMSRFAADLQNSGSEDELRNFDVMVQQEASRYANQRMGALGAQDEELADLVDIKITGLTPGFISRAITTREAESERLNLDNYKDSLAGITTMAQEAIQLGDKQMLKNAFSELELNVNTIFTNRSEGERQEQIRKDKSNMIVSNITFLSDRNPPEATKLFNEHRDLFDSNQQFQIEQALAKGRIELKNMLVEDAGKASKRMNFTNFNEGIAWQEAVGVPSRSLAVLSNDDATALVTRLHSANSSLEFQQSILDISEGLEEKNISILQRDLTKAGLNGAGKLMVAMTLSEPSEQNAILMDKLWSAATTEEEVFNESVKNALLQRGGGEKITAFNEELQLELTEYRQSLKDSGVRAENQLELDKGLLLIAQQMYLDTKGATVKESIEAATAHLSGEFNTLDFRGATVRLPAKPFLGVAPLNVTFTEHVLWTAILEENLPEDIAHPADLIRSANTSALSTLADDEKTFKKLIPILGRWVTKKDNSGVVLMFSLGGGSMIPIERKGGKPVELSFDDLSFIQTGLMNEDFAKSPLDIESPLDIPALPGAILSSLATGTIEAFGGTTVRGEHTKRVGKVLRDLMRN